MFHEASEIVHDLTCRCSFMVRGLIALFRVSKEPVVSRTWWILPWGASGDSRDMGERTPLPPLENGNNDDRLLHGRGTLEMAIVSIPDLVPERPQRKERLPPPCLRSGVIIKITWGTLTIPVSGLQSKTKE